VKQQVPIVAAICGLVVIAVLFGFVMGTSMFSPTGKTPPVIGVVNQMRQGVTVCARLGRTNFRNATEWMNAMRANGGTWGDLADAAGALPAQRQIAVLGAGYAMQCDQALPAVWSRPLQVLDLLSPLAVLVGLFGVGFAGLSYVHTRGSSRFANAVGFYRRYLELCVAHPSLAEPQPSDNVMIDGQPGYRQYELFLFVLFRACEEVLEHGDDKKKWKRTVEDQLHYHVHYLRNSTWLNQGGGMNIYSPALQQAMKKVSAAS
jgi:hypothetical protein